MTKAIATAAETDNAGDRIPVAQAFQRKAQFLTDFVEAENSMGFHADQEAVRVLGKAINYARLGQAAIYGAPLRPTAPALTAPPQVVTPMAE